MLTTLKLLIFGLAAVLLTGCGLGQMQNDLSELRAYQKNQGQAFEQRQHHHEIHQASQAAQKRLDKAIEKH